MLPSLSKVLEKLVKFRLLKFLNKHKLLHDNQYGFREKHSVLHALLDVTSLGFDAIQNNENTALLFMDLRKAFDTVSHKILLQKLYHYGIRGPAHSLIESYLSTRQQFVSLNNVNSATKPINIGVPQGSILGPLLFLIYINDLPNATSPIPRLFADDTCLVLSNSSFSSLETECNKELEKLKNWCSANELQINPNKSSALIIPSTLNSINPDLQMSYDDCIIKCENSCKYLGIFLDNNLHFKPNIMQTEAKISKAVGILSKVRNLFPKNTLLLLYYALIHPHLLYGLPLWGSTFPTYLIKLQRLQNKAIRVIVDCNRKTSITPYYYELSILKISDLFRFEVGKLMFQHSKNMLPPCFSSMFTYLSSIHSLSTRSKLRKDLYLPKFSTSRCQRSIKYNGVKIWNGISPSLRNQSFNRFKSNYKKHLLSSYIV